MARQTLICRPSYRSVSKAIGAITSISSGSATFNRRQAAISPEPTLCTAEGGEEGVSTVSGHAANATVADDAA
jgi:hypothetical protein